jgi:hypothetical protein
MSPWKDKDGLLALMVGVVLITAIILGVLAFAPLDPFLSQKEWRYQGTVDLESLKLSLNADVCDVKVDLGDLDDGWIEVIMNVEGRSGYIAGDSDVNFTVESSLEGADLSVWVVLNMDTGPTVTYDRSEIQVTIDRSVPAFLEMDVDVGDVTINVPANSTLTGAAVHADVGGLHVNLEEGGMAGDMDLRSDVGSVNVVCRNANFPDDALVRAETGTGSIYLDLARSSASAGNVTFDCLANVGSVNLVLDLAGDVSAEITSQANVGDIKTELAGFSGMDVHLVSDNHPDIWNVELLLEADVGSVVIDAEWSE